MHGLLCSLPSSPFVFPFPSQYVNIMLCVHSTFILQSFLLFPVPGISLSLSLDHFIHIFVRILAVVSLCVRAHSVMPSSEPASRLCPGKESVLRPEPVVVIQSPGAAVARLSAVLHDHQEHIQTLVEAEDAVLSRVYMLEQLCAELSRRGATARLDDSHRLSLGGLALSSSTAQVKEGTPISELTVGEAGHAVLQTWLPFPSPSLSHIAEQQTSTGHVREPWSCQRVHLDGRGLNGISHALYRSVAQAVLRLSAAEPDEVAVLDQQASRDPFLTPENMACAEDVDDDASVVSVEWHTDAITAPPPSSAALASLSQRDEEAQDVDDTPDDSAGTVMTDSFATLAYAPPSAPLPAAVSFTSDDAEEASVMDIDNVPQLPPTPARPPQNASVTVVDPDEEDSDQASECVQPSPMPTVPAASEQPHPRCEGHLSQSTQPRTRTTPSPVQREIDAFFPSPLKTNHAGRGGRAASTAIAAPAPTVEDAPAKNKSDTSAPSPVCAADLLARISTVPAVETSRKSGKAASKRALSAKQKENTVHASRRGANAGHIMRGHPGADRDGVGHVRTKRRRDADFEEEQRLARDDASYRVDVASQATPPCTPSLYWDTTMPTPYRK